VAIPNRSPMAVQTPKACNSKKSLILWIISVDNSTCNLDKKLDFGLPLAQILTIKTRTMAFDIEMIQKLYAAMPAKV
jgi:hypothetical protein